MLAIWRVLAWGFRYARSFLASDSTNGKRIGSAGRVPTEERGRCIETPTPDSHGAIPTTPNPYPQTPNPRNLPTHD